MAGGWGWVGRKESERGTESLKLIQHKSNIQIKDADILQTQTVCIHMRAHTHTHITTVTHTQSHTHIHTHTHTHTHTQSDTHTHTLCVERHTMNQWSNCTYAAATSEHLARSRFTRKACEAHVASSSVTPRKPRRTRIYTYTVQCYTVKRTSHVKILFTV